MSGRGFRLVNLAEVAQRDRDRLDALTAEDATRVLVNAMARLAAQEARRLNVASIDRTYHGCDPAWKEALDATADLANVVLGARNWGVFKPLELPGNGR